MNFQAGNVSQERLVPNPKARLREQMHEVARFKQLSLRTEEAYWHWIHRFLRFGKERTGDWRHPAEMGVAEVKTFLSHLASERNVAASTQNPRFPDELQKTTTRSEGCWRNRECADTSALGNNVAASRGEESGDASPHSPFATL